MRARRELRRPGGFEERGGRRVSGRLSREGGGWLGVRAFWVYWFCSGLRWDRGDLSSIRHL